MTKIEITFTGLTTVFCGLCLVMAPVPAVAGKWVKDEALQQCLEELGNDKGWLEPEDFTSVSCHGKGIQSLQGLELFTRAENLSFHNNDIRTFDIDLRSFSQLKTLNLGRNGLTEFHLRDLNSLEELFIFSNALEKITLLDLEQLKLIRANNNQVMQFEYRNLPSIKKIYIFNNELEEFNIYELPAIEYMDCRENPMPDELYDQMDKMETVTFLHDGNAEDW